MIDERLAELAAAYGVAVEFTDWRDRPTAVPEATVVAVLRTMGVDASTPAARERGLADVHVARWRSPLPPTVVQRVGPAHRRRGALPAR